MSRAHLPARQGPQSVGGALAEVMKDAHAKLAQALPAHLTPERVLQVLTAMVYKTPKLQQCDPQSVVAAVVQASALGLDLSPALGEAYLIPRWNKQSGTNECTFMPGYQGLVKLARQTGQVVYIQPREVCERDEFRVRYDPELTVTHEPAFGGDRGRITHLYAVAKLTSGEMLCEVMTADEVQDVRSRSSSANDGPWVTDWKEMACKTVVKRLVKRLPRSTELADAIEHDNREYTEDGPPALPKPDNQSGHGHGMYASPEQTRGYLDALEGWLAKKNAAWLDHWTDALGSTPAGVKDEFLNRYQADAHLVKWACVTGRLDPTSLEQTKLRQLGRHVAIVYHRSKAERVAVGKEMERYAAEQWEWATVAVYRRHPELADLLDLEPTPEDDCQDCDPDCDYPDDLQGDE